MGDAIAGKIAILGMSTGLAEPANRGLATLENTKPAALRYLNPSVTIPASRMLELIRRSR